MSLSKKSLVTVLFALSTALSGCAGNLTTPTPATVLDNPTAQRAVLTAETDYLVILKAANAYAALPLCSDSKPPCATLSVVRQLQKAQPAARAALDAAETAVRNPAFASSVYQTAITVALAALQAFQTIVETSTQK